MSYVYQVYYTRYSIPTKYYLVYYVSQSYVHLVQHTLQARGGSEKEKI